VVAALIYLFFASAQLQPWGITKKSNPNYNSNNKKNVYSVTNLNKTDNEDKLY
jgi:hypothetical protein